MKRRRFIYSAASGLMLPFSGPVIRAASLIPQTPARGDTLAAAGCSTGRDSAAILGTDLALSNENSYSQQWAFKFTAAASYTACLLKMRLKKVGAPAFNIRSRVWSGALVPTTLISNGTYVAASGLAATYALFDLPGLSAALTASTVYYAHIQASAQGDASNYVHIDTGASGGGLYWSFDNDDVFTEYDPGAGGTWQLFSA